MADAVDPDDADWLSWERNFILKAHFDFVVTARSDGQRVLAAIEVDGESHQSAHQQRRDRAKTQICRRAGLPLWRFSTSLLELELLPFWIAHVMDVWEWEQTEYAAKRSHHPPHWSRLTDVETCLILKGHRLVIESLAQDCWDCQECVADGVPEPTGVRSVVSVGVDDMRDEEGVMLTQADLPLGHRALTYLAHELAQYAALQKLGMWHS
jgi:hypothetical protein